MVRFELIEGPELPNWIKCKTGYLKKVSIRQGHENKEKFCKNRKTVKIGNRQPKKTGKNRKRQERSEKA